MTAAIAEIKQCVADLKQYWAGNPGDVPYNLTRYFEHCDILLSRLACRDNDVTSLTLQRDQAARELEQLRRPAGHGGQVRKCAATLSTDPPQDCDAPFCGCDPAWHPCMQMLQESGWLSSEQGRNLQDKLTAAGWAEIGLKNQLIELHSRLASYDACLTQVRGEMPEVEAAKAWLAQVPVALQMWRSGTGLGVDHFQSLFRAIDTLQRNDARNRNAIKVAQETIAAREAELRQSRENHALLIEHQRARHERLKQLELKVDSCSAASITNAVRAEYAEARARELKMAMRDAWSAIENFRAMSARDVLQSALVADDKSTANYALASPLPAEGREHSINDVEFRCILDWRMCSDPFPESVNIEIIDQWIHNESVKRGHADWAAAYHDHFGPAPIAQPQQQEKDHGTV